MSTGQLPDPDDVDWTSTEDVRQFDAQLEPVSIDGLKRTLDLFFSGVLLLLFTPVFLSAWLYNFVNNRLLRKQPADLFLRETRVNENGRFEILKFRVLKPEVVREARQDANSYHVKSLERDPDNLSVMGKVLIRTYLDELPQLWNVFVGEMSFVGPRPWPLPDFEKDQEKGLRRKQLIRPGLTGPDQVAKGFPGMYDGNEEGDYRYIHYHATHGPIARLFYDLRLVFMTFVVLCRAEGK